MSKRELVTAPMPVVLSTSEEAAREFGRGSFVHGVLHRLENPPAFVCRECGCDVPPADNFWCGDCRALERRSTALYIAFSTVARCIDLVETFGEALFDSRHEGQYGSELDAREHGFRAIATLAQRRADLLPFTSEDE